MKHKLLNLCFMMLFSLSSCKVETSAKSEKIKVMLERGANYFVSNPIQEIYPGQDCLFEVTLIKDARLVSVSYPDYRITQDDRLMKLSLLNVMYPLVVTLEVSDATLSYHDMKETSESFKSVELPVYRYHRRENSINGYLYFDREGYLPLCWNTKADFSGTDISFGSRVPSDVFSLYMRWEKETDVSDFSYEVIDDGIRIDGYHGKEESVVVPNQIMDRPVVELAQGCFSLPLKRLVIGNNMKRIDKKAVLGDVDELYLCDSLDMIEKDAFSYVGRIHINAVTSPRFSGTYYDTFPDKMDYLQERKDKKKIILFSGSSTRYGYDSRIIKEAYPDYEVVNMGVFAYVNIKPQLDMIRPYLKEGDVIVSSPEFDPNCLDCQFGTTDFFEWNEFAFLEGNYDLLGSVNVMDYPDFFSSLGKFFSNRKSMKEKDWSVTADHFDDDENHYPFLTYDEHGDFVLPRKGNETDSWIFQPLADYTLESITPERVSAINRVYRSLLDEGIKVLFTFSPKNRNCLTNRSTKEKRDEVEDYLRANLIVPVISPWEDDILPGTDFYKIDNHLSSKAARERSLRMVGYLKDHLLR